MKYKLLPIFFIGLLYSLNVWAQGIPSAEQKNTGKQVKNEIRFNILNGIVQHVSHVQHSRHIGRWNYNRIGRSVVRLRMKIVVFHPVVVPFLFYRFSVELCRNCHCIVNSFNRLVALIPKLKL